MNELIKCRGRSCENCGKPINGYAYLVKKAIHDDGAIELPKEVTYSKSKIIEEVWCKD
ncbi:hypothetical protein LCGC14_2114840, partial [marine sediment metagenome]